MDDTIIESAIKLKEAVAALSFSGKVHSVYNPLEYAWAPFENYLKSFGRGKKRVFFLGMNPGPWGMAQTGVPFGEIEAVRGWLKIGGEVGQPAVVHPKRAIQGFDCPRSEVSGRRFWGYMKEKFITPENFFREHWVVNYCPLVFMEESGKNHTPDKLPSAEREALYRACDSHLADVINCLEPEWLLGIGKFAMECFNRLYKNGGVLEHETPPKIEWILHPSPANPHANRGWAEAAGNKLQSLGVWS